MKTKLINIGLLAIFALSLLDLYGNPHFVALHFFIPSQLILCLGVVGFLFFRFVLRFRLLPLVNKLMTIIAVILTPLSALLIIINELTGPNFIYSVTRINIGNLLLFSFAACVVVLGNWNLSSLRTHRKLLLTIFPLLLAVGFFLLALLPQDFLKQLTDEDGVIETIQTIILFTGSVTALFTAAKLWSRKQLLLALIYAGLALGLLFVAGEEISWGQRILGTTTPQELATINTQRELTIHNVKGIHDKVFYLYLTVGILGTLAPLFRPKLKNKFLLPSAQLLFFFAIGAIYYICSLLRLFPFLVPWPEIAEVFLYAGATAFIFEGFFTIKTTPLPQKHQKK